MSEVHQPLVSQEVAPFEDFLDLLKQLIRQPAVTGCEEPFFRAVRRELEEFGARVTQYEGLLVAQGKEPHSAILSAHVDRHGLICTGPNEFQYAAYVASNRGDLTGDSISEQTFQLISGRFRDEPVQAYDPWSGSYLGKGEIRNAYVCERRGNMVFALEDMDHVEPGTPVAYLDRLRIQEGNVIGQLDNVLTVSMLVYLFRLGFQGTILLSAQEEAGRSWRYLLEWFQREDFTTDKLLVLDTSPYPDLESAAAQEIVLRRRDTHAEFNQPYVKELEDVCRSMGMTCSYKEEYIAHSNVARAIEGKAPRSLGSTELGRLITASNRSITGATLQVPTVGYHTPFETARMGSVHAMLGLVRKLAIR